VLIFARGDNLNWNSCISYWSLIEFISLKCSLELWEDYIYLCKYYLHCPDMKFGYVLIHYVQKCSNERKIFSTFITHNKQTQQVIMVGFTSRSKLFCIGASTLYAFFACYFISTRMWQLTFLSDFVLSKWLYDRQPVTVYMPYMAGSIVTIVKYKNFCLR
jgi:hypothetical protein